LIKKRFGRKGRTLDAAEKKQREHLEAAADRIKILEEMGKKIEPILVRLLQSEREIDAAGVEIGEKQE
jgi:hypothetical protein